MGLRLDRSENNKIPVLGGQREVMIIGRGFVFGDDGTAHGKHLEVVVLKEDDSGPEEIKKIKIYDINKDDVTETRIPVNIEVIDKDVKAGYRKIIVKDKNEQLADNKKCAEGSTTCDDLEKGIEIVPASS